MAFFENREFEVGKTYFQGSQGWSNITVAGGTAGTPGTGWTSNINDQVQEGRDFIVEDKDPTQPVNRSSRIRWIRCVRNDCNSDGAHGGEHGATANAQAQGNLLPKRLVTFEKIAQYYGKRVDGYAYAAEKMFGAGITNGPERCYPVDEYLNSYGVPVGDLFYIVMKGPATCVKGLTNTANDLYVGDPIIAQSAATSGATTAGRLDTPVFTTTSSTGQFLANLIWNAVGRALQGATAASSVCATTNSTTTPTVGGDLPILVDVGAAGPGGI